MLSASSKAAMASSATVRQSVPVCVPAPAALILAQPAQPCLRSVACNAAALRPAPVPEAPRVRGSGLPQRAAVNPDDLQPVPSTAEAKLISKTEVAAFIQRDDLMDQMYRWSIIEAGEAGVRNFGLPMNVEPFYHTIEEQKLLWGFKLGIFKEGEKLCEMGIMFDTSPVSKHEWVGRGDDGFPVLEGKVDVVEGKFFEIWKLCTRPVDEPLRASIRAYCSGLVTALNRYYAFGSVFVDDAQ